VIAIYPIKRNQNKKLTREKLKLVRSLCRKDGKRKHHI
jgi:hypothetical protein